MKSLSLQTLLAAAIVLFAMTGVGLAQPGGDRPCETPECSSWRHAPEIDPASATTAFALLAGGLLIIRGRKR